MNPRLFTSSEQGAHGGAPRADPAFTPFVTASIEEVRYAERLRKRLRERFPDLPSRHTAYWAVGAD
jgi:hypothetical protein